MSAHEVLKRIEAERQKVNGEIYSAEGLVKLQETMKEYNGEYQLVWSDDLLKEISERPVDPLHPTGIALLDSVIGGFKEQQLITIGGHTAHGKTQFGLFLIEQLESLSPLIIPLEQSNEELIAQRRDNGYSIPRFLSPRALAARVTVDWIEERVVEGIAKHNSKVVMIDHLGYINDFGTKGEMKGENAAYRIGQVMKGLKNIAKKWNVIVFLLVHISQHEEGKPPSLEDVKNSSDIIQESDMVMLIWRKNTLKKKVRVYENKSLLSIQKNRRTGRNASLGFLFDTKTGRYTEDNSWVQSLIESAERAVQDEDLFESL